MGRHTKLAEAESDAPEQPTSPQPSAPDGMKPPASGRLKWITRVPLLPAVAGAVAIGVCAAAWSTSQISLNFTGGGDSDHQHADGLGDSTAKKGRAGRSARSGVVIIFPAAPAERTSDGFKGAAVITNRGTKTVSGWTISFKIPNARVLSATNAVLAEPGATVAVLRNPATVATLRPGESVRVVFTARGAWARPTVCKFNRVPCTLATR